MAPRKSKETNAVAPKARPKAAPKAKQNQTDGKRFSSEFLLELAAASTDTVADCRKVLEGLDTVLVKQSKEKKMARIPNVLAIRIKVLKARAAAKKNLFGVERETKAKPERKKLVCTPIKSSSDSCKL